VVQLEGIAASDLREWKKHGRSLGMLVTGAGAASIWLAPERRKDGTEKEISWKKILWQYASRLGGIFYWLDGKIKQARSAVGRLLLDEKVTAILYHSPIGVKAFLSSRQRKRDIMNI